jgi:hypothetical protein
VSKDLFPTLVHPTLGTIAADLILSEPQELRVADVPTLRAAVEGYLGPDSEGPKPTTNVLSVLDAFEAERTTTALAAGVVTAQLALLAWLLLYLVVTDTSEARGSEVALAKLRGLPPRAVAQSLGGSRSCSSCSRTIGLAGVRVRHRARPCGSRCARRHTPGTLVAVGLWPGGLVVAVPPAAHAHPPRPRAVVADRRVGGAADVGSSSTSCSRSWPRRVRRPGHGSPSDEQRPAALGGSPSACS